MKLGFTCPGMAPPHPPPRPRLRQHSPIINEENAVYTCLWAVFTKAISVFRFLFPGNSSWYQVGKRLALASTAREKSSIHDPDQLIIAKIRQVHGSLDHSWKRGVGTQGMTGPLFPFTCILIAVP